MHDDHPRELRLLRQPGGTIACGGGGAAAFAVGCSGARGGTEQAGVVVVVFPPMDLSRGVESAYWQQVCIGMSCHEVMASIVGSFISLD